MPKPRAKPAKSPAPAAIDTAQRPGALRQVDAARPVDSYTHDEHSRANIPPVGLAGYDTAAEQPRF
jgi:hypothetical protein